MRPDQERVRILLTEAVTLLCRNSLQYEEEVTVEGLIGVTLDKKDIFLVSIKETIETAVRSAKRSHDEVEVEQHQVTPKILRKCTIEKDSTNKINTVNKPLSHDNTLIETLEIKPEPSDNFTIHSNQTQPQVAIKVEKDNSYISEQSSSALNDQDRRFSDPSYDATSQENNQFHYNRNNSYPQPDNRNNSFPQPDNSNNSFPQPDVSIKEEKKEEVESCFIIDSDEEDYDNFNDMSNSSQLDNSSMSQSWNDNMLGSSSSINDIQFKGDDSNWQFDVSQLSGSSMNILPDGSQMTNNMDNQRQRGYKGKSHGYKYTWTEIAQFDNCKSEECQLYLVNNVYPFYRKDSCSRYTENYKIERMCCRYRRKKYWKPCLTVVKIYYAHKDNSCQMVTNGIGHIHKWEEDVDIPNKDT